MSFLDRILGRTPATVDRMTPSDYLQLFSYAGNQYAVLGNTSMPHEKTEQPDASFQGYTSAAYMGNAVVFACLQVRLMLFSEARFQFRALRSGRPGKLFGNAELRILEEPWPNGSTGDLLARMEQDTTLGGNAYILRDGQTLRRLRPDWMTIILGSRSDPDHPSAAFDAEVIGYVYYPGGVYSGADPVPFFVEQVAHYVQIPDPLAHYRGVSLITCVLNEIISDNAMTTHKQKYLENGATPNFGIKFDATMTIEAVTRWIAMYEEKFGASAGPAYLNAYKTLFLGPGAEPVSLGSSMEQLTFKEVQGAGETRIAAAFNVPPILVGLSEGLESATYSNYQQARRRFADGSMRPLWRRAAQALSTIITVPDDAELWYDDRDIPFLAEDVKDAAEVMQANASTIQTLVNSGWDPDTARDAVIAGDMGGLVHTGLLSVQLQEPGAPEPEPAPPNGNGAVEQAPARALEAHLRERLEG